MSDDHLEINSNFEVNSILCEDEFVNFEINFETFRLSVGRKIFSLDTFYPLGPKYRGTHESKTT